MKSLPKIRTNRIESHKFSIDEALAILDNSSSTELRRDAAFSISRRRDPALKPHLLKYLGDRNPAVVLQVIRGLLAFRDDVEILSELKSLRNHPNEMVRDVVSLEIFPDEITDQASQSSSLEVLQNLVVQGDALEILRDIPACSIHLTFTSPPYYNARDYAVYQSYEEYLNFLESVFSQVHRITKTRRFFVLNTSPVIFPRPARKYSSRRYPVPFDIHPLLDKMGWEFIDDIVWSKPVASSKNRVAGFELNRKPLTYKANARTEYVMVYRKKTHKLIDWNLKQYSKEVAEKSKVDDDFERSNVWEISPTSDRVHSAVFPLELCDQIVKLYSFEGDLVLDPFAGSGTLGLAALSRNRKILMTELRDDYVSRIKEKLEEKSLFEECRVRSLQLQEFRSRILNVTVS